MNQVPTTGWELKKCAHNSQAAQRLLIFISFVAAVLNLMTLIHCKVNLVHMANFTYLCENECEWKTI